MNGFAVMLSLEEIAHDPHPRAAPNRANTKVPQTSTLGSWNWVRSRISLIHCKSSLELI
jgi:hypothetical protein